MKQEDIRQIKRFIWLEEKISNIRLRYPEVNKLNKAEKIMFFSNKMHIEERESFTLSDWEYFNTACILPFEEISQLIEKYDNSNPKANEIIFVDSLQLRYNVDRFIIVDRIKEVRIINDLFKTDEKQEKNTEDGLNRSLPEDKSKVKKLGKK